MSVPGYMTSYTSVSYSYTYYLMYLTLTVNNSDFDNDKDTGLVKQGMAFVFKVRQVIDINGLGLWL